MSSQPGQKCPPIKDKEKTKKKQARTRDLPDERQSRIALKYVPGGGGVFEREWDERLQSAGLERLDLMFEKVIDEQGRRCYLLPGNWPEPRGSSGWLLQLSQIYRLSGRDVPSKMQQAIQADCASGIGAAA